MTQQIPFFLISLFLATSFFWGASENANALGRKKDGAPQGAPASSTASQESQIWIARKDGAQSCGVKAGQTLEEGASELKRNGIRVLDSHKGNDGKMHALSCGMPTGTTNAFLVPREDLIKATSLGYQEVAK